MTKENKINQLKGYLKKLNNEMRFKGNEMTQVERDYLKEKISKVEESLKLLYL